MPMEDQKVSIFNLSALEEAKAFNKIGQDFEQKNKYNLKYKQREVEYIGKG